MLLYDLSVLCDLCCVCVCVFRCVFCVKHTLLLYGVSCVVVCFVFVRFALIMLDMCLCAFGIHCVML